MDLFPHLASLEAIIATNLLTLVIPYTDCNFLIHRCGAVFSLASGCVHDDNALCRRQARRCADVSRDAHRDEKFAAKARLRCHGHSRKCHLCISCSFSLASCHFFCRKNIALAENSNSNNNSTHTTSVRAEWVGGISFTAFLFESVI